MAKKIQSNICGMSNSFCSATRIVYGYHLRKLRVRLVWGRNLPRLDTGPALTEAPNDPVAAANLCARQFATSVIRALHSRVVTRQRLIGGPPVAVAGCGRLRRAEWGSWCSGTRHGRRRGV